MKRVFSAAIALMIVSSLFGFYIPKQFVNAATIPTISILSVVPDTTVTIKTANYPANDTFQVTMGLMGTKGVDGVLVTTINSGTGGSFEATFSIPPALRGEKQIAIRLESPTSGYFSYNWFWNNLTAQTTAQPTTTPAATTTPSTGSTPSAPFVIPTISIVSVVAGQSVTIQSANFPANQTFEVLMNRIGTRGIAGILVETINSGTGGSFTATYTIPEELSDLTQIAIRLESPTSGYFSYNWFWNTTGTAATPGTTSTPQAPTTGTATPVPAVSIPLITITSVIPDQSVTLQTENFPANQSFEVRMGKMGTRGVDGVLVTTVNSGTGGSFSSTFTIPEELRGLDQIAIRLESPSSGYFSYNWFWNKGE